MNKILSLFFRVLSVGTAIIIVYNFHLLVGWFSRSFEDINPTILAAIVAASATVIASIFVATYNARKTKELTAREANRAKKAEAYNNFMRIVVQSMKNVRSQNKQNKTQSEKLTNTLLDVTSAIIIYGGPRVVKAYGKWRQAAEDPQELVVLSDKLLREMRSDLGESNRGITDNDILSLFIIGGKSELDKMTSK